MKEIVRLDGIPQFILMDSGPQPLKKILKEIEGIDGNYFEI